MLVITRFAIAALVLAGLSACASVSSINVPTLGKSDKAKSQPKSSASADEGLTLGRLPANNLPDDSCGALLWTVDGEKPLLIFRAIQNGETMLVVDGKETFFETIGQSGEIRYGIAETQYFSEIGSATPMIVSVKTQFGDPFQNGVYMRDGVITVTNAQSWERVTPAAGLAGCRQ